MIRVHGVKVEHGIKGPHQIRLIRGETERESDDFDQLQVIRNDCVKDLLEVG